MAPHPAPWGGLGGTAKVGAAGDEADAVQDEAGAVGDVVGTATVGFGADAVGFGDEEEETGGGSRGTEGGGVDAVKLGGGAGRCGDVVFNPSCFPPRCFPPLPGGRRPGIDGSMKAGSRTFALAWCGRHGWWIAASEGGRWRAGREIAHDIVVERGKIAWARGKLTTSKLRASARARDQGGSHETSQWLFHPVSQVWETTRPRFTMVKRFPPSLLFFHAKIPHMLMCQYIKCAWHSGEITAETGLSTACMWYYTASLIMSATAASRQRLAAGWYTITRRHPVRQVFLFGKSSYGLAQGALLGSDWILPSADRAWIHVKIMQLRTAPRMQESRPGSGSSLTRYSLVVRSRTGRKEIDLAASQ